MKKTALLGLLCLSLMAVPSMGQNLAARGALIVQDGQGGGNHLRRNDCSWC